MGATKVDQLLPDATITSDFDEKLTESRKNELLLSALPGAEQTSFAGQRVIRYGDNVIFKKQVTYLGNPWPGFKKRIQIPNTWLHAKSAADARTLTTHFVGIYHYNSVTIFVDFTPDTYVKRKANNSAAHVATNDLYQAQTLGIFSRSDRNGNHLTSIRHDYFSDYLRGYVEKQHPSITTFERFNSEFLTGNRINALDAVKEMYAANWPDTFQGEWPGFYLEYYLDSFLKKYELETSIHFQKLKDHGSFDFDLVFKQGSRVEYYGDLKASNASASGSPGNDAEDLKNCIDEFGRFWYIIYEHDTWRSRDNGDHATRQWNEWRQSVGHLPRKGYDPLSYWSRFKEAVRFTRMFILEVNKANIDVVFEDFNQGRQADGSARALKVMIRKRNIDNFLIYSTSDN